MDYIFCKRFLNFGYISNKVRLGLHFGNILNVTFLSVQITNLSTIQNGLGEM